MPFLFLLILRPCLVFAKTMLFIGIKLSNFVFALSAYEWASYVTWHDQLWLQGQPLLLIIMLVLILFAYKNDEQYTWCIEHFFISLLPRWHLRSFFCSSFLEKAGSHFLLRVAWSQQGCPVMYEVFGESLIVWQMILFCILGCESPCFCFKELLHANRFIFKLINNCG